MQDLKQYQPQPWAPPTSSPTQHVSTMLLLPAKVDVIQEPLTHTSVITLFGMWVIGNLIAILRLPTILARKCKQVFFTPNRLENKYIIIFRREHNSKTSKACRDPDCRSYIRKECGSEKGCWETWEEILTMLSSDQERPFSPPPPVWSWRQVCSSCEMETLGYHSLTFPIHILGLIASAPLLCLHNNVSRCNLA